MSVDGNSSSNAKWSVSGNTVKIIGLLTFTSNEDHTILTNTTTNQNYTLEGN